eukprot:COSAG05_NODE_303_length_11737_cov_116.354270_6_plen_79_part_00
MGIDKGCAWSATVAMRRLQARRATRATCCARCWSTHGPAPLPLHTSPRRYRDFFPFALTDLIIFILFIGAMFLEDQDT